MLKPFLLLFLILVLMSCSSKVQLCAEEIPLEAIGLGAQCKLIIVQSEETERLNEPLQYEAPLIIESGPNKKTVKVGAKQRRDDFAQNMTAGVEKMGGYTTHSKGVPEAKYLRHFFDDVKYHRVLNKYKEGLPFVLNIPPGEEHEHRIQIGILLPAYQQFDAEDGKVHLVYPSSPVQTLIIGEVSLVPDYSERDYLEACRGLYSLWRHRQESKQL